MSYTTLTLATFHACLDYSDHPEQALLALDLIERLRLIADDPKYYLIQLDASINDHDFSYWAAPARHGNENDLC